MPDYVTLGSRQLTATLDTTGNNTGNYTNWFSTAVLGVDVPYYEVHHAIITNAPAGASASIYINGAQWSFTAPGGGGGTEWDPANPMLLRPGDEIFFYWSTGTAPAPTVTLWLRFDTSTSVNRPQR